jgi:hypothetical protein
VRVLGATVIGAVLLSGCGDDASNVDPELDASADFDAPIALTGLVASWEFDEGDGVTIRDSSGVAPALDLEIFNFNQVTWEKDLLQFDQPTIARTVGPATKIIESLMATSEITIELWVRMDNTNQSSATIVSLGRDGGQHNFWAGMNGLRFQSRIRLSNSDLNGDIHDSDEITDAELTHVVHTRDATTRRIYVDTVVVGEELDVVGNFADWDLSYRLSFGGETDQDVNRFWTGELHRIAIYSRALEAQEVFDNHSAGPGTSP